MWDFAFYTVLFAVGLLLAGTVYYVARALWTWRQPMGQVILAFMVISAGTALYIWLNNQHTFVNIGGIHFCKFNDMEVYFQYEPCDEGRPSVNYMEWTNWKFIGGGFVIVADTCHTVPILMSPWESGSYWVDNPDRKFEMRHVSFRELTPDPSCHVAFVSHRHSRDFFARTYGPGWSEVETIR